MLHDRSNESHLCMRSILVLVTLVGCLPVVFRWPHVGVLLWTWLAFMNPHRISWGIASDIRLSLIVGLVTIVAWLFSREPKTLPMNRVSIVFAMFVFWLIFTTPFAEMPDEAWTKFVETMKIMLMTVIAMCVMQSRERIHALIWMIVLCIGYFGFKGGLFAIATGGNYLMWGPPGTFLEANNSLAVAMVMTLPILRYLQLTSPIKWVRWGMLLTMVLFLAGIAASYSRGAWLACGAMLVVLWLRSRKRVLLGFVFVAAVGAILALAPEKMFERFDTIETYEEDDSAMTRIYMWKLSWDIAVDRPLTGGGFGVFDAWHLYERHNSPVPRVRSVHSSYFEVLGEHGFPGLILFLGLMLAGLTSAGWIIRNTRNHPQMTWARDLAAMLQVSIVGFIVGGSFIHKAYFDVYLAIFILLATTHSVVERELRAQSADSASALSPGGAKYNPPPAPGSRLRY